MSATATPLLANDLRAEPIGGCILHGKEGVVVLAKADMPSLILGPKFFQRERSRMNLSRFYAIAQTDGIKIHDTRIIRLLEVLLHGGNSVGGWSARQIHEAILTTFQLSANTYGLNQLRYDLRKLKGHCLLERDGSHYAYRLTAKGVQIALLFLFFHKTSLRPASQ